MIVAGIDPGKRGAMTIVFPDNTGLVFRVPLVKKPKETPAWRLWEAEWSNALAFSMPDLIIIERVSARPGQGVTSMYSFGATCGFAHAIALASGARVDFVSASVWKVKMGLAVGADKNASRERLRNLLPSLSHEVVRVKDSDVAESALMALYGRGQEKQ